MQHYLLLLRLIQLEHQSKLNGEDKETLILIVLRTQIETYNTSLLTFFYI